MYMKTKFFILLFFISFGFTFAQQLQFSGNFAVKGIVFSGDESPFWFHSNQRGRVNEISNFSGLLTGMVSYNITDNARFTLGVGGLYQDGYIDRLQFDESYLGFENSWLAVSLGRKQQQELYQGLSATNQNILWSLNARPIAGISFKTKRPVYFWKEAGLAFQASLEEFFTDDDRYVPDTRIHHKSVYLIFDKVSNFEFTIGVEHVVQWAGTSTIDGKLPSSFADYLRVVTGQGIGNEELGFVSEQEINALGNHIGSYVAGIKTSVENYNVEIIYNHLFEDESGMRLRNTPDGRYGIYIADKIPGSWIDGFMYEFYYTRNQSKNSPTTDGIDNYFNNSLYRSGWTYENRIIGVPFIFLDKERFGVINNKLIAHHFGITGVAFSNLPYKLLGSYRKNYGAKGRRYLRSNILSTYLDLNIYQNLVQVNLQLGADFNTISSPNFGAGIQVSKILF